MHCRRHNRRSGIIYVENLAHTDSDGGSASAPLKPAQRLPAAKLKMDTGLISQLRSAVEAASDEDGWAALANVGSIVTKQAPDFDSRTYGYGKLSDLITATTLFEIEKRSPGDGKPNVIYVRGKRGTPAKRTTPSA